MDVAVTLDRVLAWATSEVNIRVVVLAGSFARGDADRYSDLDIALYVADPVALLEHDDWYRQFGRVLVVEALANQGWNPTRLVYYAGGKIDFTILSVSLLPRDHPSDRPVSVLLDKDGVTDGLPPMQRAPMQPPAEAEFLECVNWFYAAVIMWAKYVARNDPWAAKVRDWESKGHVLRMLEWDHRVRKGWGYDTWYLGLHLRQWVDPDLLPALEASWSGIDPIESVRAIRSSLALFDTISTQTADGLGFRRFDSEGVRDEVERLLDGMTWI